MSTHTVKLLSYFLAFWNYICIHTDIVFEDMLWKQCIVHSVITHKCKTRVQKRAYTQTTHGPVVFPGKINWGESLCHYALSQRGSQCVRENERDRWCRLLCVTLYVFWWKCIFDSIVLPLQRGIGFFFAHFYPFYFVFVYFSFFMFTFLFSITPTQWLARSKVDRVWQHPWALLA